MRKKILGWGLLAAFVLTAGAGLVLRQQFYGNAVVTERDLYVSARAEYGQVADSLLPQIKHLRAFDAYARRINLAETFKPGHYVLKHGMSVIEIARMLKLGLQTPVRVTINNVRIPAQLAQKLARQIDADSTAIMQALTSKELAAEVGFDSVTLFSMFIPDSYEFYWTVTPGEFVRRMKREYDRFWTSERDVKRKRSGLSRLEVMTLASIVYEETRKSDEMPRVAGVYVNRLKKGIKLQADPTVKYAMQDFGLRRILYRHLKYDSPYNTYVNEGLPPSPICMPGKNAIDAVLNYEKHDYIFFCARPDFDGLRKHRPGRGVLPGGQCRFPDSEAQSARAVHLRAGGFGAHSGQGARTAPHDRRPHSGQPRRAGRGRGAGVSDDHHVGQGRRPGGGVYDRSRADPRALRPRGRAGHRRRHRRQRPHDGRGPDGRRAGDTARRQG